MTTTKTSNENAVEKTATEAAPAGAVPDSTDVSICLAWPTAASSWRMIYSLLPLAE